MGVIAGRQPWLDVVRGIAVAGMIVVNNPGSWDHVYWPLAHAPWHGWTAADLIFPLFLFIVGVSISFAFSHSALGNQRLQSKVLHRTLLLYALGVLITAFPYFDLSIALPESCSASLCVTYSRLSPYALCQDTRSYCSSSLRYWSLTISSWLSFRFLDVHWGL